MRYCLALLLVVFLVGGAQQALAVKHSVRYRGLPRSEGELVARVVNCLKYQDTIGYYNMFPPFDTLWQMVLHNPDHSAEALDALNELKEHPRALIEFDPYYNPSIMERFSYVLQKGTDSGIHWGTITLARYELQKQPITRSLIGFERIAPERFMGYIFIRDISARATFCFTITEMQKIHGSFVGGQVNNIMEASTVDEYNSRIEFERNYIIKVPVGEEDSSLLAEKRDSIHTDSIKRGFIKDPKTDSLRRLDSIRAKNAGILNGATIDDDTQKIRREVVDRKYYEGKFDDEIPVELFVRYMKDISNGKVMYWDALYKFGDQKSYIKLEVTRNGEKWDFDDDPPVGSMELVLKNRIYTGSWQNNESQSGYDVVLKEAPAPPRKIEMMDKILERGLSGRTDEASEEETKPAKTDKKSQKSKRGSRTQKVKPARSRSDDGD